MRDTGFIMHGERRAFRGSLRCRNDENVAARSQIVRYGKMAVKNELYDIKQRGISRWCI